MKIKDLFWKLFWLMLRGKGNTKLRFDSEAVCFKTHLVEISHTSFDPKEDTHLDYDLFVLHWNHDEESFVRIKGDIDDIQAIIKHVNDEDNEPESLDKQIEEFAKFKQSDEGIKKLIQASENI